MRQAARFAAAPLAALAARATLTAALEAYLGRRSAARVQAGALRRGAGETIRAALLSAGLRDLTALSEATEPAAVLAALDAWFDRIAGAVHTFGGEVLKFIGDGVLAIFPVIAAPAWAISMRRGRRRGCRRCPSVRRCISASAVGQYRRGRPAGLHRHRPRGQPSQRLEGLCRPLGRSVLIPGAVAAETTTPLVPLGEHVLRGIATPCTVFTLPDA